MHSRNNFSSRKTWSRFSGWLAGSLLCCLLLLWSMLRTSAWITHYASGSLKEYHAIHQRFRAGPPSPHVGPEIQSTNGTFTFPRICRNEPLMEPIWEWNNSPTTNNSSYNKKRLLIATYSAYGKYARLLELTSPINKAYAKRWNHDILVVQGTTMILPWDNNCTPPEERSRFNKVDILLEALSRNDKYDQLLLLDADTLIYDFSFDVTQLISDNNNNSNNTMLVAQRTTIEDNLHTHNINNGVTLWNLHHPLTAAVAADWNEACRRGIPDNRPYRGDQYYLRRVLQSEERIASISTVWDEFYYRDGTVIKHFQRSNARSWNETGLDNREERIMTVIRDISNRYGLVATDLDQRNYTSIRGNVSRADTECIPRRKSVWSLRSHPNRTMTVASKRLLIAQYSSFGSYASLLELTAPINKAYARKWNHDMLIVQGAALELKTDEVGCEPPSQRSMYNKIPILLYSLSKSDEYDQLLLLDADTLIYDMGYDVTNLLDDSNMLAAQRVAMQSTEPTWNINNGVTLWNLHHNMTQKIAQLWLKGTVRGIDGAKQFGWIEHGDQFYLHKVLRQETSAINFTKAVRDEFCYDHATVIKHFVRPSRDWTGYGKDMRAANIKNSIDIICANFTSECQDLEYIPYSSS